MAACMHELYTSPMRSKVMNKYKDLFYGVCFQVPTYRNDTKCTEACIFVFDSSDVEGFDEARDEFLRLTAVSRTHNTKHVNLFKNKAFKTIVSLMSCLNLRS